MNTPVMRAKMRVINVDGQYEGQENIELMAVGPSEYPPEGSDENNTFAKFTPSADMRISIVNPDLLGKIKRNQEYYLDFTLSEKDPDGKSYVRSPDPESK